jgi:predicted N-acetyltransferase YhbS
VHLVRALLARGSACTDSLSGCLAVVSTVAPYRHHRRGGLRVPSRSAVSSRSSSGMEKTRVSRSMKAPPEPDGTGAGRQSGPGEEVAAVGVRRMSTRITIRCTTENDARSIAKLARELGYATTSKMMRSRIRAILLSPADFLIVAVDSSGSVIGWLQAHAAHVVESGFRVEILGLIVSTATRRRGVGRSLVTKAERWAKSISAEVIVVRSNATRVESHAFYPALGYASTKTQLVYRKPLVAPSPTLHATRRPAWPLGIRTVREGGGR